MRQSRYGLVKGPAHAIFPMHVMFKTSGPDVGIVDSICSED